LKESQGSGVIEDVNCEIGNSLTNLNSGTCNSNKLSKKSASKTGNSAENADAANNCETPQGNQELSKNRSMVLTPAKTSSLENLFSLDMDDLFEDSDFDLSCINSNLKTPGTFNHNRNSEKTPPESSSSAFDQGTTSAVKSSATVSVSSGTTEVPCSDKEWSMGCGILDKQGNPVQVYTVALKSEQSLFFHFFNLHFIIALPLAVPTCGSLSPLGWVTALARSWMNRLISCKRTVEQTTETIPLNLKQ